MEYKYKPEDVAHYLRWQERLMTFSEKVPAEVFKWLGWTSATAAVQIIDMRLNSSWLQFVAFVLSMLLVLRVQWFLGMKHPEVLQPDGSLVVKFQLWKILASLPAVFLAYFLAFGMASLIAKSDLLPPARHAAAATQTATPQTAEAQQSAPARPTKKPQGLP